MKNILKLLNKREQKILLENKNLTSKLWKIIPESNKRPMGANDIINILKNENLPLNINSISKKFNIILKKNMRLKKYNSKSKFDGNQIIIEYKDEKEIPEQIGHIFQNFLSGIYFQYPPKYNLKTIDFYEEKAKNFAIRLNLLIVQYELISSFKKHFEIINSFKKHFEIINSFKKHFEIMNSLRKHTRQKNNLTEKQYLKNNKIQIENVKYDNNFYQAA
ncbi:hypothetical protein E4R57_05885 [Campylobacter coli]|nr:hypothetical protein [Campylobacter coli]EAI3611268.1 hypothetical protein [Campylobacter coli]EAJ0660406.1 hypothetical protein [Campylobacter coli]EAJ4086211.1 hypothetical protein [Campylobacter coli]EAJ8689768.1 hypothetical protein [Campylobacter coli]